MNLSKSEGVWGNEEASPHITKCESRPLQQPDTQPNNDGATGKTDHVSGPSPSQSPSALINSLLSFIYLIISYGSGNRTAQNESIFGLFYQAYPPPPVPSANAEIPSRNIFPNFGDHDA